MTAPTTLRSRCLLRSGRSDATEWWRRRWDAPSFEALVCRGVVASIATGAVCGALAGATIGALSAWVSLGGTVVLAVLGTIVGAFLGGPTGVLVAPVVAAVLVSTHGTRRRALFAGAATAAAATTLALLGILTVLSGGHAIDAGTVWFLGLADVGAVVATRALVVGAVTSGRPT